MSQTNERIHQGILAYSVIKMILIISGPHHLISTDSANKEPFFKKFMEQDAGESRERLSSKAKTLPLELLLTTIAVKIFNIFKLLTTFGHWGQLVAQVQLRLVEVVDDERELDRISGVEFTVNVGQILRPVPSKLNSIH